MVGWEVGMRWTWLLVALTLGCDEAGGDDKGGEDGDDTDVVGETDDTPAADDTDAVSTATCDTTNEECAPGVPGCRGDGPEMLPGADCVACHTRGGAREAPAWSAGGTAFTDIDGTSPLSGATVRVTDSTGEIVEMRTNRVGNFYTSRSLTPPLTAEIEVDGQIKRMATKPETGACSSCHTCDGEAGGKLHGP